MPLRPLILLIPLLLLLPSHGVSQGVSAEEGQLLADIARCFILRRETAVSDLTQRIVDLGQHTQPPPLESLDVSDRIVSAYDIQPGEIRDAARMTLSTQGQAGQLVFAKRLQLPAKLLFGDLDQSELYARLRYHATPGIFQSVDGTQLPKPWTGENVAGAHSLATLRAQYTLEAEARRESALYEQQIREKSDALRQRLMSSLKAKAAAGEALSPKQSAFMRNARLKAVGEQLAHGSKISAGISVIFNIQMLWEGELRKYVGTVVKDVGTSALCQGVGISLEEVGLENIAPGAGVIVFGLYDAFVAARTGDWTRFGRNTALNTGSTVVDIGGMKAGAMLGGLMAGPPGAIAGGVVGGILAGVGTRVGLASKTRLGAITDHEKRAALNKRLSEVGLQLDEKMSFEEVERQLKNGEFRAVVTSDLEAAMKAGDRHAQTSLSEWNTVFGGDGVTEAVLSLATHVGRAAPNARLEGLRAIKTAVCGG